MTTATTPPPARSSKAPTLAAIYERWGLDLDELRPRAKELGMQLDAYLKDLRESFPFFLHEIWTAVNLPLPSLVQYDVAQYLERGPRRRCIKGFRGLSKTWITIAYVLWRLFKNVNERVLFVSESLGHSRKSLHLARQWIDNIPFLRFLRPRPATKQRDSGDQFDTGPSKWDRVASVTAMGITGQITGGRSSLIVCDDIETPENTLTRDQRMRIRERIKEFASILLPGGDIIFLGTPHHEETVYDELPDKGYAVRSWPARYPAESLKVRFLAPILKKHMDEGRASAGDPTWPERFDNEALLETELDVGRSTFSMQFMLVSGLGNENLYPLKLADLIVFPVNAHKAPTSMAWGTVNSRGSTAIEDIPAPGFGTDRFYGPIMVDADWLPYHGTKAFIDPAGGGNDELAWAIVGQLHGLLYAKAIGGVLGGATTENLERVVADLRRWGASDLFIETNFGGDMLIQLVRPILARHFVRPEDKNDDFPNGWACNVEGVHSVGQKELRIINALEPVMNQHRLVVSRDVAADKTLMLQLTRITRERGCLDHDDRLDALAGCVGQWKDVLDQDANRQATMAKQRAYDETMKRYYGRWAKADPNWIESSV